MRIYLLLAIASAAVSSCTAQLQLTSSPPNILQKRRSRKSKSIISPERRCGVITTDVDILATDNNVYALRSIQLLQEWLHDTYLIVQQGNDLTSMVQLHNIVKLKRLAIRLNGLKLRYVDDVTAQSIADFCPNKMFHIHHGSGPIPKIANAGTVGVFIPHVQTKELQTRGTFSRDAKKRWLSFDQVWLSTWEQQLPYSTYILPIVEYTAKTEVQSTWPVINSVVVPPAAQSNDAFLIRTLVLLSSGVAENQFKGIFHRIPDMKTPLPAPTSSAPRYAAIIYEGRIHYAMKAVCHNTMNALVPKGEWDLHIFHSNVNRRYINSVFEGKPGVYLHNVDNKEISVSKYNVLLTSEGFWRQFERYERVLIFQTDSFFLRQLDRAHLTYDYVGAPWCLERNPPAITNSRLANIFVDTKNMSVGNGGLSIRNPAAMLRCVTEYKPKAGLGADELPEDVFFIACLTALNMSIPEPDVAGAFSIEQTPCHRNFLSDRAAVVNMNTTALHAAWIHSVFLPGEFDKIMTRYESIRAHV